MGINFQELDSQPTVLGEISLRRRRILQLDGLEVFEVKINDDFLMSSLFHVVEDALADLALAELEPGPIDIVVGGLGLGYTAVAALKNENVRSLIVVDLLKPVIEWHEKGLVPLGQVLTGDPRCRLVQGDFFGNALSPEGFDPLEPGRKFHAVLLDIDHSPERLLAPTNGTFYSADGLRLLRNHILPGGVFALWSDDGPEEEFLTNLSDVFKNCEAFVIEFDNPVLGTKSRGTVYHGRV